MVLAATIQMEGSRLEPSSRGPVAQSFRCFFIHQIRLAPQHVPYRLPWIAADAFAGLCNDAIEIMEIQEVDRTSVEERLLILWVVAEDFPKIGEGSRGFAPSPIRVGAIAACPSQKRSVPQRQRIVRDGFIQHSFFQVTCTAPGIRLAVAGINSDCLGAIRDSTIIVLGLPVGSSASHMDSGAVGTAAERFREIGDGLLIFVLLERMSIAA